MSLLKYVLSFFWKTSAPTEAPLPLDEAYNVIAECEEKLPNQTPQNEKEKEEEIGSYEVFRKVGKITQIIDDAFRIDDLYDFKSDIDGLLVGSKISYQLIKSAEGEIKIVDVHVLENDWNVVDTGKKSWHERILICKVVKRDSRVLTLSPGDIIVNLNSICTEFIPIEGDWVELDVKCEIDENVIDLNGKIIEINKLLPLRPQVKLGHVTQWDSKNRSGVVDKNIFFDKDSLYCGYIPVRGDKVIVEIIESNQAACSWRALKVLPDHLHFKENKDTLITKEETCYDTHDSVSITDNISLTFTKLGESKLFAMEIESREEIQLVCIEIPRVNGQCRLSTTIDHYTLKPARPLTIRVECKAKNIGESQELLIFHFETFRIKRWISINVASYRPKNIRESKDVRKEVVSRDKKELIKGQKIRSATRFLPLHMPDFAVPERLFNLITANRNQTSYLKSELERMKPCLATTLNYMNFEDKFHTLLHLDEIHALLEMQNYDQERVCFVKSGEYLLLQIDNLAERRPSVIMGDRVIARSIKDPNSPDFEGYIHKIGKNHVFIKFSQMFHDSYDGEDYSIYIKASRVTYRRKHFAVNLAVRNLGKDWLFPTKIIEKEPQLDFSFDNYVDSLNNESNSSDSSDSKPCHNVRSKKELLEKIRKFNESTEKPLPTRKLEWHNKFLNYYQKEAVRNILLGVCRPLPYIIFGPPGTGKTVTVVETVLQILRLMPHSRILLCAPSNSAADLLALRLIDSGVLKPGDLIRMVAITAIGSIPPRLAPFTATANTEKEGTETSLPVVGPNGLVLGCSSTVLGRHRLTICTCSSAGLLYSMGFSKGHFSHVIVDEAGQTSEPSVLIPLAFLDVSTGQAILAGDPMQLGPVILSHIASEYGLEESFLERMISRFPYMKDSHGFPKTFGYDPRMITKLIYNYRSLPNILKLPSLLFYNDDLIPTISEVDSNEASLLTQLEELLPRDRYGKTASLIFHGVIGENFQTEDSPSWFNPNEASQVFFYINELFRLGVKSSDIGIITPYKAQIKQLLELFKEADFDFPKVGTVEEFQGQEFNVIILSTVRSNKKHVASDLKYTMGFVASPRRLNVAITRAKALLIIIGNPKLLSMDRSWRSVINYCIERGSYIGCPYEN
ncbi:RNA helicase Mov10l1 [Tribolium castaneum]|uniref:RNA helicase n=1 Tax=Tribolium castaneum TaxID=7070 RepID=D6WE13_TRICA|nr:PREDICTED: putative helicase Mov10l1 [Tribolium castaneum]EFA01219.2 putative RNA helicase armi-like Protein [Tribolium castaneum]|eukprot:XP_008199251.1 PREDICTED: putative helicase Mov10l1 [Tribolium castaneum]